MENEQPHPDIEILLEDLKEGYGEKTDLAVKKLSQNASFGTIHRLISILTTPAFLKISPLMKLNDIFMQIGEKAVPPLIEALYSSNQQLVLRAVKILFKINSRKSISALIELVERVPLSSPARGEAISSLGRMADDKAIPVLVGAFERSVAAVEAGKMADIDPFIYRIAYALTSLWGESRKTIYQALISPRYQIRSWAWESLRLSQRWVREASRDWTKGSLEIVDLLLPLLKSPHWRERFNIVLLLRWSQELAEEINNALIPLLSDSSTSVRYVTVLAINSRIDRVKFKLLEMLGSDPQPMVRTVVVENLGHTKDLRFWPAIIRAIREDDELVRAAAIRAASLLCKTGVILAEEKTRLVTLLLGTLTDTRLHVRRAVFMALGNFSSDPRVISVYREELFVKRSRGKEKSKYDRELYYLIEGLGKFGTIESFEVFVAALKSSELTVRSSIAEKLGQIQSVINYQFVIEALIERIEDIEEDSWVQRKAAVSLGKLKSPLALQPLLRGLKIGRLQIMAAEALGEFGSFEAVPELIKLLESSSSYQLTETCAKALGQLGDKRAVLPLADCILNPSVKSALRDVCTALGQLKDNRAVPALIKALQTSSEYVREAAAAALGKINNPPDRVILVLINALDDEIVRVRLAAAQSLGEIGNPKARPALEKARDHGVGFSWDVGINNSLAKAAQEALSKLNDTPEQE